MSAEWLSLSSGSFANETPASAGIESEAGRLEQERG